MSRRTLGVAAAAALLLLAPGLPDAQPASQPGRKVPRIGLLRLGAPPASETADPDPVLEGLRDLGYVEGRTVQIERRWAEPARLRERAAELVRLNVDVIVAGGPQATQAAKEATASIPIVMSATTDPVGAGLVASLARPGGNVTGSATLLSELGAKRLELLREALPRVSRVAVLHDPTTSPSILREVEDAAPRLRLQLQVLAARTAAELDGAFQEAHRSRAEALSVLPSPLFLAERTRIARLAGEYRLPLSAPHRTYTQAGALMSYGPNIRDLQRRAAVFVDKILKGARPGDLPIEQATTFELVINLRTARALGLTIPPALLRRADQVVE